MRRRVIACVLLVSAIPLAQAESNAKVDESALRYYASLGQKKRVAVETKRLQKADPGWRPPADLYSAKPGRADEDPLWALYGQNRLDELVTAIALRQAVEPAWRPSGDLVAKIETRRLRAQIMRLAKSENWRVLLKSFEAAGISWAKDDAEVLWVIAEAYAHEKNNEEAYVVYRFILANHDEPAERRATIEHAITFLPMVSTEKLIAMGRKDAAGRSEFDPIAVDITRARISAFLHDEPANDVVAEELRRFQDAMRTSSDPNEPGLVAWYAYKRRDYSQALDWFKLAIGRGGDAMIAHGLAHTLRKLGMKREAEEVAYAWRDPLVNNAILYIDLLEEDFTKEQPPYIEANRVSRYAQVTMATESGEGAQALAWYAYNTCQYPLSLKWFERAVAWLPKEATVYGYALSLQRLHRKEFREVVNRYDGLFPKVVALAFDDGIRRPPQSCGSNARQSVQLTRAATVGQAIDWTGRTMIDTLRPQPVIQLERRGPVTAARVPSPDMLAHDAGDLVPLKKKTDFPFAVLAENDLRFSALTTIATGAEPTNRSAPSPLVARRVPGVGSMPYERYGFTLRLGWDGTREASTPANERSAPAGTLWALEQSLRQGGTRDQPAVGADLSLHPIAKANPTPATHSERRL